jgi:hypothetical protein
MIFLNGSINRLSQQQIEQEAAAYEANGWELRDSTSHNVRITIAVEDIPAFCEYLQQLPLDQKPKVWTDRRTGEATAVCGPNSDPRWRPCKAFSSGPAAAVNSCCSIAFRRQPASPGGTAGGTRLAFRTTSQ